MPKAMRAIRSNSCMALPFRTFAGIAQSSARRARGNRWKRSAYAGGMKGWLISLNTGIASSRSQCAKSAG